MGVGYGRRRGFGVLVTVGVVAGAFCLLLVAHRVVPDAAGSVLDSALPWTGAPILLLLVAAGVTRRITVVAVALAPVVVWGILFGPALTDRARPGDRDLRVASLNLGPATPGDALPALLDQQPDVIVLQEITPANRTTVTKTLAGTYPHHTEKGTVGIFSRFPLPDTEPVDIQIGWTRALAATVATGSGPVRLYAAHLASARFDRTAGRDRTLAALATAAHADPSPRLVLAGDLNTATTDRQFADLAPLRDTQQTAGAGFGFTWPAALPLVRPDHILERGLTTRRSWVVRVPGSDHRAVLADFDAPDGVEQPPPRG